MPLSNPDLGQLARLGVVRTRTSPSGRRRLTEVAPGSARFLLFSLVNFYLSCDAAPWPIFCSCVQTHSYLFTSHAECPFARGRLADRVCLGCYVASSASDVARGQTVFVREGFLAARNGAHPFRLPSSPHAYTSRRGLCCFGRPAIATQQRCCCNEKEEL